MNHYHIDVCDGQTTLQTGGVLLPDLRAARRRAIELSGSLIACDVSRLRLGGDWRMDATDGRRRILLRLDLTVFGSRWPSDPLELQESAT